MNILHFCLCVFGATVPQWARVSSFTRFLDHTQRHTTVGRTPLDEWSARSTELYLTAHNTHNRQTSLPPMEFEHTVSASERMQTHALDRAATGTGTLLLFYFKISILFLNETRMVAIDNCYCLWGYSIVNKDKFTNLVQQISASLRRKFKQIKHQFFENQCTEWQSVCEE